MRAHYFQHVPFEGLGSIAPWLKASGYRETCTRFYEKAVFPDVDEIDMLIIMGGPMSANDENELPWLDPEKRFIRDVIDRQKPVLGVCLGAQLIASAMGERVFPNPEKEIGWHPIEGLSSRDPSIFRFPSTMDVFHWHGETVELPSGAIHLARSAGCEHQAFQLGDSVIGLQFHLETTPQSLEQMLLQCGEELVPAAYVQTKDEILAVHPDTYEIMNGMMNRILAFLHSVSKKRTR